MFSLKVLRFSVVMAKSVPEFLTGQVLKSSTVVRPGSNRSSMELKNSNGMLSVLRSILPDNRTTFPSTLTTEPPPSLFLNSVMVFKFPLFLSLSLVRSPRDSSRSSGMSVRLAFSWHSSNSLHSFSITISMSALLIRARSPESEYFLNLTTLNAIAYIRILLSSNMFGGSILCKACRSRASANGSPCCSG